MGLRVRHCVPKVVAASALAATLMLSGLGHVPTALPASAVTIGLVADLSGSASVYGISIRDGVQLAETMINAHGGIHGHPLSVLVEDSASQKTQVINLYEQLINAQHVLGLIGPTLSSEAQVADPIAQKAGIPVVATSNTAPGITAIGNYIFRDSLGEADVIPLTLKVAQSHLHFHKVAIIYANDNAFTIGDGAIFKIVAQKMGLRVVDTETFATGDKDFSAQLTKIKAANPDAILVGALAAEAVPLMIQARQLGIPASVHFIGGNGFNSPAIPLKAGASANGAIEGTAWFPGSTTPQNKAFVTAYKKAFGKAPDQFAAQAYDGLNLMAAAIARANTTSDHAALRTALVGLKNVPVVTGATGTFSFKATRDAGELGTVQIIQGGQFRAYTMASGM